MPYFPSIPTWENATINTQTFYGLNKGLSIAEGEMADMLNMTADHFPVLSTRRARSAKTWPQHEDGGAHVFTGSIAGMMGNDHLVVCHGGTVYVDGAATQLQVSDDEHMKPKHMVAMGAYVCIWPDKVYLNLTNPDDYGPMGTKWMAAGDVTISAMMCRKDGTNYDMESITISDTAPAEPEDKQLWMDTSGENDVLKQYSTIYAEWIQVATTYIKLQAYGLGKRFKVNDVVHISNLRATEGIETAAEGTEETLEFPADEFRMSSSFTTTHQGGTNWVSTEANYSYRTVTIEVEGIPEGATVKNAVAKFKTNYTAYGAKILTMNNVILTEGEESEVPVEVQGNGPVNMQFVFKSYSGANVSGSHTGYLNVTNFTLEVTYETSGSTEEPTVSTDADDQQLEALNTTNIIYGRGDDYIIVAGLLHGVHTLDTSLRVELKIPDLDYVCEANNRLWGCSYSDVDGALTNEIRACALGDFRNWYNFMGTSMDSYVVSVGSDGRFTGAFSLQGVPLFWKEDYLHKISGTLPSNYTMNTLKCRGVQEGSWRSQAVVNETLYYKARTDVMAYDGAMPYSVSEKLGSKKYYEGVGGGLRDKYYLCMRDADVKWHMFVYDAAKGLWHKEDERSVRHMASVSGELILAAGTAEGDELLVVNAEGAQEKFPWSVTFGVFGYAYETSKYLSRFNIRAQMTPGSVMRMEIMYDSNGEWVHMGTMQSKTLRTFMLPVIPRRCDHCQVRLSGTGEIRVFSVARVFEQGGDG